MWHRVESAVSSTAAEGMLHTAIPGGKRDTNITHKSLKKKPNRHGITVLMIFDGNEMLGYRYWAVD